MREKKEQSKRTSNMGKAILLTAAALILTVIAIVAIVYLQPDEDIALTPSTDPVSSEPESEPTEPPFEPMDLGQGLVITHIAPYTGSYMEDGTNEVISDVLMVILENNSEEDLQYARILLDYGQTTAEFPVTNIPAGARVVLLEKSRMPFASDDPDQARVADVLFMEQMPMYPELYEISGEKGSLTVKNISDQPITGDIYVYYKNSAQDIFYGGITYRAKIEGGLLPGETKQTIAAHYNPTGSTILMVSYSDQ